MEYSYWSGEIQGMEEKLAEDFAREPSRKQAFLTLTTVLKMRSDFLYYRKKGMVTGDLPPFDSRFIWNIFASKATGKN